MFKLITMKKLTKKRIENLLPLSHTSKPDHDDVFAHYDLPNGVQLHGTIISFNEPCKLDTLYGLDDFLEITTKKELVKVIGMSYDELLQYVYDNDNDFDLSEWQ